MRTITIEDFNALQGWLASELTPSVAHIGLTDGDFPGVLVQWDDPTEAIGLGTIAGCWYDGGLLGLRRREWITETLEYVSDCESYTDGQIKALSRLTRMALAQDLETGGYFSAAELVRSLSPDE